MEYVYAALLLHKAGQEINEKNVTNVLEAANLKVDNAQVKALVNAISGVDIEKVVKEASAMPAAVSAHVEHPKKEEKKEEKSKEEEKKSEEAAAAGLGALFG